MKTEQNQCHEPLLVSVKEATRVIGLGKTRLYELIDAGTIETVRIGGRRLVKVSSLRRLAGE